MSNVASAFWQEIARTSRTTRLLFVLLLGIVAIGLTTTMDSSVRDHFIHASDAPPGYSMTHAASSQHVQVVAKDDGKGIGGETDFPSPLDFKNEVKNNTSSFEGCRYLTFCRWATVANMPSPVVSLTSMNQIGTVIGNSLASFVFSVAGEVFLIVGIVMTICFSIDFMTQALMFSDHMFAKIGITLMGFGDGGIQTGRVLLNFVILAAIIGAAVAYGVMLPEGIRVGAYKLPGGTMVKNNVQRGIGSIIITIIAVVLLGICVYQSARNHQDTAAQGGLSTSKVASNTVEVYGGVSETNQNINDPQSWAPFSLGWTVAWADRFMGDASNLAGSLIGSVSDALGTAVGSGTDNGTSNCDMYVKGMHKIFRNTSVGEGTRGRNLMAYDDFVVEMYYKNYQLASLQSTVMAANSWCHSAEMQVSAQPGDQAFISREAGMFQQVVGKGQMGLSEPESSPTSYIKYPADTKGTMVNANGTWAADPSGQKTANNASNFFGPLYGNGTGSGNNLKDAANENMYYWAICSWNPSADGTISSGSIVGSWKNVKKMGSDDKLPSDMCGRDNITANDAGKGFGSGNGSDVNWLNYHADLDAASMASNFLGAPSIPNSIASSGSTPAISYYMAMSGQNTNGFAAIGFAFAAIVGSFLIVRYMLPLGLGMLVGSLAGTVILIFLAIIILIVAIPIRACRQFGWTIIKTLLSILLMTSLISLVFELMFIVSRLMRYMLPDLSVAELLNTSIIQFIHSIISVIGTLAAFWVMRLFFQNLTGMNMSSFKATVQSGMAAGAPILRDWGVEAASPIDPRFWRRGDDVDPNQMDTVKTDENSPAATQRQDSNPDILRDDEADAASVKSDDPTKPQPGGPGQGLKDEPEVEPDKKPTPGAIATMSGFLRGQKPDGTNNIGRHVDKDNTFLGVRDLMDAEKERRNSHLAAHSVPIEPEITEENLKKHGVVPPTAENIGKFKSSTPGMSAPADAVPGDPETIRSFVSKNSTNVFNPDWWKSKRGDAESAFDGLKRDISTSWDNAKANFINPQHIVGDDGQPIPMPSSGYASDKDVANAVQNWQSMPTSNGQRMRVFQMHMDDSNLPTQADNRGFGDGDPLSSSLGIVGSPGDRMSSYMNGMAASFMNNDNHTRLAKEYRDLVKNPNDAHGQLHAHELLQAAYEQAHGFVTEESKKALRSAASYATKKALERFGLVALEGAGEAATFLL